MHIAAGTTFGGRWIVERPLSSGGMGDVYVARHAETGRRVALKVVRADRAGAPEIVARFRREAKQLAAVTHPNVVGFLDSGDDFLVMELLEGRSLRSAMAAPYEWRRALGVAIDVCRGLAALHEAGIVHRDLKPENVFLQEAVGHDEPVARLIDLGIARLDDSMRTLDGRTQTFATAFGIVVGTLGYISPEQLRGETATAASDLYAVGVILYEMLTGRNPFTSGGAADTNAVMQKQLSEPLAPPRDFSPFVPAHVDDLVLRFLARDPAQRFASAKDAIAALVDARANRSTASLAPDAPTEAVLAGNTRPLGSIPASSTLPLPIARARGPTAVIAGAAAGAVAVGLAAIVGSLVSLSTRAPAPPSSDAGVVVTVTPAPAAPIDAGVVVKAREAAVVVKKRSATDPRLDRVEHGGAADPPKMSVLTAYARRALVDCSGDVVTRLKIVAFADGHVEVDARPANECARDAVTKLSVPAFDGKPVAVELELGLSQE